ncbi:GNAT family N-acetyltransferase [filamentous cyanobacterium LEGE 11480]|uniref:GNAT family N-acetyltransferase n=1 Tax=Romeriopsis navalis LEGE 11480 TaxID=2777977 RepID=A0A928Z772_9CYAN|nr:GNAT family N-acetyltransferase [Romeriopsis navalis]MBE9033408.1 GNAT family N-acetyltransferase [Romeriopsis navalis LEGE 11480]
MPIVRPYDSADLAAVLAAWENASKIAHPFLQADFQAQVRRDIPAVYLPNADTWVVEADEQVVGFIALIGNEVGAIFLQPAYQGQHLGKLMMDQAQALHGELEVEVFEKNTIGRNFYAKYGFRLIEKKIHEPTGECVLRLKFTPESPKPSDTTS